MRAERAERRFERPMLVATALVIPTLVLDDSGVRSPWTYVPLALNWGIWIAFAVELVVMLRLVPDRRRWLRTHPVEVVSVLSRLRCFRASSRACVFCGCFAS